MTEREVPTPSSAVASALHAVLDIWAEFIEEILRPGQPELHALGAMSLAVSLLEQDRSKLSGDSAELLRLVDGSSMARRNISGALQGLLESDPHLMSITAVQISRERHAGLAISGVFGRPRAGGPDEVADRCCPDYARASSPWVARSTVGGPSNG